MINAKFVGKTFIRGEWKNRWECPSCRKEHQECRFNLSKDKISMEWKCRFCKTKLYLKVIV